MQRLTLLLLIHLFIISFAMGQSSHDDIILLEKSNFETILDGKEIQLFTLKNKKGITIEITNYGGKIVSLWLPDRFGNFEDVVLGYSNIEGYQTSTEKYFGALIGRYGNRIANGKFILDGKTYSLAVNNGKNHLHGGNIGFDAVVWDAKLLDDQSLELHYISKNLEEGYPGNLNIKVIYTLTDNNELKTEYWAKTDKPTVVNLTQHSFFNLQGAGSGTINDHLLQINAAYYTPVDEGLIPIGEISTVENTPMDFRNLTPIGQRLNDNSEQLTYGRGYDHNFVLNQSLEGLNYAAKVVEPVSGRVMQVYTNEPGLQFYGGNFLDGSITGKKNKVYTFRSAFCLETQHFPDSPNQPQFPSTRLDPNEEYYSICIYKFSTKQ